MTIVKKTAEHKIIQRRDNRYAVTTLKGKPVNGDEKVAILQAEGLLKKPEPKPEPVEEVAEESTEEGGEEAAAEE
jgi:hypothetical protein